MDTQHTEKAASKGIKVRQKGLVCIFRYAENKGSAGLQADRSGGPAKANAFAGREGQNRAVSPSRVSGAVLPSEQRKMSLYRRMMVEFGAGILYN